MKNTILLLVLGTLFMFSCGEAGTDVGDQETDEVTPEPAPTLTASYNQLTEEEKAAGWKLLFDGESADGWHSYNKDGFEGWEVKDGMLMTSGGNGDIITDDEYENFDLMFDFKVEPKGNSGVMYLVVEDEKYESPYLTGPEYQVIDDENYPNPTTPKQKTGANYDVHAPMTKASLPAGEWNTGRIIVSNGKVEHWLNGKKVVEYQLRDDAWKAAVTDSKWKDVGDYGMATKGKIDFQDHGDAVAYRNIKIREL